MRFATLANVKRLWSLLLAAGLLGCQFELVSIANNLPETETFLVSQGVDVPGGKKLTTIDVENYSVRLLLNELAEKAGFNLLLDDSVEGAVTVSLKQVKVNDALDAVLMLSGNEIFPQGSVFLVIAKDKIQEKGLTRSASKILPLKYGNSARLAEFFNQTLFGDNQHIRAEARTNSLIVIGTPQDIAKVEKALVRFDVKRHSKTFYLSHANALDVATLISSTIFNDGSNPISLGSAQGGGGAGGGAAVGTAVPQPNVGNTNSATGGGLLGSRAQPSPLKVEKEIVAEGSGTNEFAVGDSNKTISESLKIRSLSRSADTIAISPAGPLVVPNSRLNAITIMGTLEQIAMVENMLPVLDAQVPQVAIEASLVEVSLEKNKELAAQWGTNTNHSQFGFGNENKTIGVLTPTDSSGATRSVFYYSSTALNKPKDLALTIKALIEEKKAKIIANPTVIASHESEAVISVVDEVIRRVTVTLDGTTGTITRQVELGDVGIILDILPRVGDDGTVNMRIRPSVSSIRDVTTDASGNTITLLNRRDMISQNVRIEDGKTLVLGGLIQETNNLNQSKIPLLGDAPILSAFFRASQRSSKRTELVMLITPHILSPMKPTEVHSAVSASILSAPAPSKATSAAGSGNAQDQTQIPQVPFATETPSIEAGTGMAKWQSLSGKLQETSLAAPFQPATQ
ncbi:MAG: secretin N-terminal domain-containing protein [Vampirovibrionales bacterium]|nr:secretin N-terminal domain-containing protein [Vampirovibrionales bacterium]